MAENTTIVSLPQLVDLSLNCPELGSFNFNMLHVLLHVILKHVDGNSNLAVEFRGADSDRVQNLISATRPTATMALSEFTISGLSSGQKKRRGGGGGGKDKKGVSLQDIKEYSKEEITVEEEIRIIERRKDSKEDPIPNPLPLKSPPGSAPGSRRSSRNGSKTVVVVDSESKLPQLTVAVTKDHFQKLETEVTKLRQQVKELTEMPANMGLIEATRSQSGPILDMFQILNLTKRMDAAESGIEKIVSLIEDLAKEKFETKAPGTPGKPAEEKAAVKLSETMEKIHTVKKSIDHEKKGSFTVANERFEKLEERIVQLESAVGDLAEGVAITRDTAVAKSQSTPTPRSTPSPRQKSNVEETASVAASSVASHATGATVQTVLIKSVVEGVDLTDMPANDAMILIQKELSNFKVLSREIDKIKVQLADDTEAISRISIIEHKFIECVEQMNNLDNMHNSQLNGMNDQLTKLQTEFGDLMEKINLIMQAGDSAGANAENTTDLYNKLLNLEQEMVIIHDAATKLQEEKEEREKTMEAIKEQIDFLKIVKANREDLEDALGDKADACMINRKVSHDQFDAACDDLSRGIEEALQKLSQQEEMWHQALDSIQREVGNKLDKLEVDPLRDFVNSKLKALQEKFKTLTSLRREQEAAGTKSRFLRNVNCISCDKDVVMRREMDVSLRPQPYAMPPNKNIAPYLAYELDQLRKQQKCAPSSKNLNFLENALKTRGQRDKDHVCNRYCGGSHTTTTPQQRVTRLGHFLEQWGPEIAPLNDEYIRGKDNQMYKARDDNVLKRLASKDSSQPGKKMSAKPGNQGDVRAPEEVVTKDNEIPQGNIIVNIEAQELLVEAAAQGRERASVEIYKTTRGQDDISFLKPTGNEPSEGTESAKKLSVDVSGKRQSEGEAVGGRKASSASAQKVQVENTGGLKRASQSSQGGITDKSSRTDRASKQHIEFQE